jgi:S1-C subfamily serine protease
LNMRNLHSMMSNKLSWVSKILPLIVVMMLLAVVFTGCSTGSEVKITPPTQTGANPNTTGTTTVSALYDENTVVALYKQSIPAVVEIKTVIANSSRILGPFQIQIPNQVGQGSGFFIDSEGHILTNNHVVDNATTVTITLHNGKTAEAKVIGTDPQNDLALLKVNPTSVDEITYLSLGDSDAIEPGQMAIAMGSPFGLEGSITVGIVSGIERSLPSDTSRPIANVIQTDASINPGNSGGPLLNSKGEVIGINTAIEASGNGIGFAVPINTAKSLLPALKKGGEIKSPWLGIEGVAIDQELAKSLGLPVETGVYIIGVISGSPAEKAGLKESGLNQQGQPTYGGDIIIAVDNVPVAKVEDLVSYFNSKRPGDKITLSIYRGDKQQTIALELGEWPETPISQSQSPQGFDWGPFQ